MWFYREHPEFDPADDLPIHPPAVRCRCSHPEHDHGTDAKGRLICYGSVVCGCAQMRPQEDPR